MTRDNTNTPAGEGRSPSSQVGLIAAATVLALIVVASVIVFATRHHGGSDNSTASPTTTTTAPPAPSPDPASDGFATPTVDIFGRRVDLPTNPSGQVLAQDASQHKPTDSDWLTAVPVGLRRRGGWQQVHGAVVPFSTSDGPTHIVDGAAVGYAHTPQGAALAAAYTFYQIVARPADLAMIQVRSVLPTVDREQFDAGVRSGKVPMQMPDSITRFLVASDAFKIDQYSDDFCIVRLAMRGPASADGSPTWTTGPLPMVWASGDWKLRFPGVAGAQVPTETINDLVGWTQW
ncbi:hypothetical protein ACQP1G_16675 [Nocardia sp. CA-107356]|uniref:hypothetical protein n=1 Tax=Nocardia sp. CA-107356 TaxID=3239972 RepID=UPI003D8A3294